MKKRENKFRKLVNMTDILFILKKRLLYSEQIYSTVNSGLYNSATFVNNMLIKNEVKSHLIEVIDNNEIDKYVSHYKPKYVIIEAIWVVPEKFEVLQKLHPKVKWIIRLHSELPFLANEGNAIDWLKKYTSYDNVFVTANSKTFIESFEPILHEKIVYLPNYYPITKYITKHKEKSEFNKVINIGLFGAIRPMKNSLTQAIGAMIYADRSNQVLHLHINVERIEQKGENALKNIRDLFKGTRHKLIEHKWLKHSEFVKLVSTMDLGLQVSLSETYNIVSADFVNQLIPVVTSNEIPFINALNIVEDAGNAKEIADKINVALLDRKLLVHINKFLLLLDSNKSEKQWLKIFKRN
jgi:hypothetical protein